ncbi:MAG: hypothetical protein AVDCRST_MAG39-317 [uncultured Sphingomonadaceae bacterium]|uniref:Uncharacterized protein n=1 Tax=uncultured Sphingomonadaceae bacterium TaxID=169976 RepID=A0A6J4S0B0_9SPHN|nr:MAG: hypothetical protein AVDCRST_MAG39-317 [uncultured Sphingomonadaceae bacterium]
MVAADARRRVTRDPSFPRPQIAAVVSFVALALASLLSVFALS